MSTTDFPLNPSNGYLLLKRFVALFFLVVSTISVNAVTPTISLGFDHSCVVTSNGLAKCWGYNYFGQLGNNSTANSYVPVEVFGLSGSAVSIDAGFWNTCVLTIQGQVKCWGHNYYGQLGNNSTADSYVPVDVIGLENNVTSISIGQNVACAVNGNGGVKCWGFNRYGQMGNNPTDIDFSLIAIDVVGLHSGVKKVDVNTYHGCALMNSGEVKCWGENGYGQLGNGSSVDSYVPVTVAGLSNAKDISVGEYHACALTDNGAVKCWGSNHMGALGNNSSIGSALPVPVVGLDSGIISISVGASYSCALTNTGAVRCWGSNIDGQLGINSSHNGKAVPQNVIGLESGVKAISASYYRTCALMSNGQIKCWGSEARIDNIFYAGDSLVPYLFSGLNLTETDFDFDNDFVADSLDNCMHHSNDNQLDTDGDAIGDECDIDNDNDLIADDVDNCPFVSNFDQLDTDGDVQGNACDLDDDNDGQSDLDELSCGSDPLNVVNLCVEVPDLPVLLDSDEDGVPDDLDNCPFFSNYDQLNTDGDAQGNDCDLNDDNDVNTDIEELVCGSNPLDAVSVCDTDSDGLWNNLDNCPLVANSSQLDVDADSLGDVCDTVIDKDKNGLDDAGEITVIESQMQGMQSALISLSIGKEVPVNQYKGLLDSASKNADLANEVSGSIRSVSSDLDVKSAYYVQRRAEGALKAELKIISNEQKALKKQIKTLQKAQKNYLKAEKKILSQAAKLVKKNKLSAEVTSLAAQIQQQEDLLATKKAELGM